MFIICIFFPSSPYSKPVWDHFWKVVLKGWPSVLGLWKLTMFDCYVQGTFCPIMVASHARLVDCRQAHAWDLYASYALHILGLLLIHLFISLIISMWCMPLVHMQRNAGVQHGKQLFVTWRIVRSEFGCQRFFCSFPCCMYSQSKMFPVLCHFIRWALYNNRQVMVST